MLTERHGKCFRPVSPGRANDTSCIVMLVVAGRVEVGTAATLFLDFVDESYGGAGRRGSFSKAKAAQLDPFR